MTNLFTPLELLRQLFQYKSAKELSDIDMVVQIFIENTELKAKLAALEDK